MRSDVTHKYPTVFLRSGIKISKIKVVSFGILICIIISLFSVGVYAQDGQEEIIPFVVATYNGPGKLDPLDAYDSESINTIMQVCEGLYIYNYSSPEMESIPCLAQSMGVWSNNYQHLTIELKEGVTFHDGSKFNASAVKWNFDRLQYWTYGFDIDDDGDLDIHDLGTASKTLFKLNDTVILNHTEIIDEYTIKFVLNRPCVIWEKLLAFVACSIVLPDQDYEMGSVFFNRIDINDELIGTGPFKLTEYDFENQVVFDYNPDYHMIWGEHHIERMIYLITSNDEVQASAILNHEAHWGGVDTDYQEQFDADPALVSIRRKASVVYWISMNMITMPFAARQAAQWSWNYTHFLDNTLEGKHYELHVPVPDGMEFHHSGFEGEPCMNITQARLFVINSTELNVNVSINGLSMTSTDEEWINVAESTTPICWFNYSRYESGTVLAIANQLKENLKMVGIRLEILDSYNWDEYYLPPNMAFSFGGWGPDYNDPINMIEPIYNSDLEYYSLWGWWGYMGGYYPNDFMLIDPYLDGLFNQTYYATDDTTPTRQELFYEIQEYFVRDIAPSFYILQLGGAINFNRDFVDESSVRDILNCFADLYWFHVRFTPPEGKIIPGFQYIAIMLIGVTSALLVITKLKIRNSYEI